MPVTRRNFLVAGSLTVGGAALLSREMRSEPAQKPAAGDLSDWANVRQLFNLSPEWTHASLFFLASHPRPVRDAVEQRRKEIDANPFDTVEEGCFGPLEHNHVAQTCIALAKFIGANPDDIALTANTTNGLALVYHGLALRPGDEILMTAHDHFVHHESVRLSIERSGATTRRIALFEPHDASHATEAAILGRIRDGISAKTRVLGITWVHSSSGVKLPLAAIAAAVREVNAARAPQERIITVVDGVHGLGADDPNIVATGIDVFVSGLHKWMLAPRGTGFVWARPEVWATMRPLIPTFTSFEVYEAATEHRAPRGTPSASWFSPGGFHAYEHFWGVPAAIELHTRIGWKRIAERVRELNGAAKEELAKMPHVQLRTPMSSDLSAGIICFEINGMAPDEVVSRLRAKKVIASTSPYKITYPRLSFGIANSEEDVERSIKAVRALLQ